MNARVLGPEEWIRLEKSQLPGLLQYCRPEDVRVVVVESDGKIVAAWSVIRATHLEGVWIDPEHRNAGVTRTLIKAAMTEAHAVSNGWAFTGAADEQTRDILQRLGAIKIPMDTYAVSV